MAKPASSSPSRKSTAWDTNAETKAAVQKMVDAGDMASLEKAMCSSWSLAPPAAWPHGSRLRRDERANGHAGDARLALHLENTFGKSLGDSGGVAIAGTTGGGSLRSERFALIAAEVLLRRSIRVCLLPGLVHTPLVPFCVIRHGCKAGIMVTASHSPKEDNGYKVYWDNGAQIIPQDSGIAGCIAKSRKPWASYGGYDGPDGCRRLRSLPRTPRR